MKSVPRPSTRNFAIFALLFLPIAFAQAVEPTPRLESDPRALTFAAMDAAGNLTWSAELDLALWASGADEAGAERTRSAITEAVAELAAQAKLPERDLAEYVLAYSHKTFLKTYSERQTRLDAIIDTGRFNCVSSAALYLILGSSVGLDIQGVATKDHAFCSVRVGAERIDVETTSPYGFDPGSRTEFHDEFGRTTGFAYVSPRNYRDRGPIGRLELISLIISNRIVELESRGRYAEAVGLALDRKTLLSHGTDIATASLAAADKDLLERLLNYGASLARAGAEADALDWARVARATFGDDPRWDDFVSAAANNLLVKYIRSGQLSLARSELSRISSDLSPGTAHNLDTLVTDAELVTAVSGVSDPQSAEVALAAITAARERGSVAADRAKELSVFVALREAERVAKSEGWVAAMRAVDGAIASLGADKRLEEARRAFRANRLAELHNAFAVLFNAREYAQAKAAAAAAVEEFPEDPRLKSDLSAAEKALAAKEGQSR